MVIFDVPPLNVFLTCLLLSLSPPSLLYNPYFPLYLPVGLSSPPLPIPVVSLSTPLSLHPPFLRSLPLPLSLFTLVSPPLPPQITQLDPGSSLLEARLFPQETLFLEAKE